MSIELCVKQKSIAKMWLFLLFKTDLVGYPSTELGTDCKLIHFIRMQFDFFASF